MDIIKIVRIFIIHLYKEKLSSRDNNCRSSTYVKPQHNNHYDKVGYLAAVKLRKDKLSNI